MYPGYSCIKFKPIFYCYFRLFESGSCCGCSLVASSWPLLGSSSSSASQLLSYDYNGVRRLEETLSRKRIAICGFCALSRCVCHQLLSLCQDWLNLGWCVCARPRPVHWLCSPALFWTGRRRDPGAQWTVPRMTRRRRWAHLPPLRPRTPTVYEWTRPGSIQADIYKGREQKRGFR